jgi:putative membrane protein
VGAEAWLPGLNAALIVISGVFLVGGYASIRARRVHWHRTAMLTASAFAALFVVVYVTRWAMFGSKSFEGDGFSRLIYFGILVTHVIIAILVAPLAVITLRRALGGRFTQHRQIARITLPLWVYTAVTGWAVYWMLYSQFFAR